MAETRMGRPRQTHCKRGHPLTPETTRVRVKAVRVKGPYLVRDCLECARLRGRERNRQERRRARLSRVMVYFNCSLEEAKAKVARGVDLRRYNALPRQAYANQPRNRAPGARLVCCGIPVDPAAGKWGCANCNGDRGPARWVA